jgi:AAA+ superfamily predicted ATPase
MWREILGLEKKNLVDLITPRRTFKDVILPEETRQQLFEALTQIEKHRLIFQQWGLGERHPTGLGLAFNFAGPPGTGKTICAEAVAQALGRKMLRVRYSEVESCWVGETGKNIRAVFREARTHEAVLFFDEADSIASRRFSSVQSGHEREANQSVNILLKELEELEGVTIFATNMAANFDAAFERRIRTHILFRLPTAEEREKIWKVQIHPQRTPLGKDVDFRELAERFEVSGGDIRNAVLKAAQMAAAEQGPDETKRILQRHFLLAMEQVQGAKQVLLQNAITPLGENLPWQEASEAAEKRLGALDDDLHACRTELAMLGESQESLRTALSREHEALREEVSLEQEATSNELQNLAATARDLHEQLTGVGGEVRELREQLAETTGTHQKALADWRGEHERSLQTLDARLARMTLIPIPRAIAAGGSVVIALLLLLIGIVGAGLIR